MKDFLQSVIRKVTLELIYEVVDERTQDICGRLNRLEDDMRELRGEMNRRFEAIDRRFEALSSDINRRFEAIDRRFETMEQIFTQQFTALDQKLDALNASLNGRIDQLFNLITNQRKA